MSKVSALNGNSITPAVVLNSVAEQLPEIKELYVVALSEKGEPTVWASGQLNSAAFAALCLHDLALKSLNGMVYGEDGEEV
jgi:hypothetical protein